MPMNLMQGALAAAILQSRQMPQQTVISGAALSAMTPGLLGLVVPLMLVRNRDAAAASATASGGSAAAGPSPGTGTSVTVTPVVQLVSVPDLTGETEDEARKRIAGQLVPDVRVAQRAGGGAAGMVVAQDREPSTWVPQGSAIVIYLQARSDFGEDSVDME